MNIENFTQNDWENNPIEMVRLDDGNGNLVVMPKSTYDTLVSESAPTVGNN